MVVGAKIVAIMNVIPGSIAASFRSNTFGAIVLRPLVNRLVPEAPTPIVVRSGPGKGLRLLIYPRNEKYYWSGTHETAVQQAVASILTPGMRFWDVGAHIGFFTLLGSRFVGDSGHVHSFEPMPQNRERLTASIRMNDLKNITVHDIAVSATSGEAVLHAHKSSTMWTLMRERGEEQGLRVRCCTLDELAQSVAPPHLIKVDVEGAEVDVLRGGLGLLSSARPRLIVEFSDDTLLAEARSLLPSYAFERLAPHHWLLRSEKGQDTVKVAPVAGRTARQGETRGSGAMIIDPYLAKRAARKVVTTLADWWLTKVYDVRNVLEKAEVLPQSVGFETTNICNANCVFCAYQYQQRPTGVMDMSLCRRLTREVADLGILGLGFTPMVGEPLVDPYILERISLARDQGVKSTSLFTNGILFRKVGVDRILKSGLAELRLSTAGFDDASYRRIYRSTRYRQMYDGLVELLERNEGMGHPVKVIICIRADEPMSVIRRKPDFRRIAPLVDGVDANLRFDSWSGRIAREELPAGMQLRRPPRKTYPCSMLYFGLTVLWDGRVSVCGCRDLDVGDDLLLGNAHSASLLELWSGSKLADLRRRWLHERQIPDVCGDCTHYQPATRYLRPDLKRQVETAALNGRSRETVTAHSAIDDPQGDGERS